MSNANPLENRTYHQPIWGKHVAREFYHVQHFERAAELCEQALGRSYLLTREAQIEALRLRALALARRGKTDDFYRCVEQLEKYHERVAKRNAKFLRGFKLRWEGKPDQAEQFYREAYRLGGDRNFYVLRELAQVERHHARERRRSLPGVSSESGNRLFIGRPSRPWTTSKR